MEFYDVVKSRKSIKKFKNTPVNKEKLAKMIDSAMMSPSWKNNTSYKFILVDEKNKLEQISKSIMNKDNSAAQSILDAPMTAVIVAKPDASGEVENREYYLVDSAIAMEHFILSATNEGYGTCWIAAIDEDIIKKALAIPQNYKVVAMTPIGEIAESKEHNNKKDAKDYVFLNTWDNAYAENTK
ncbi:nitroreductase family protein [Clostridium sp. CM028]|uniref:nitroreductase family protein n=1 Tax=unclassified Clostridium TaxID=2614128 RepID=UPI001C0C14C1|nr:MULTISPECIES: nitroreductase family protein [unclassified Clostridium]MBU3093621.1 nitroreductase family protein [Clostridium sp. CF011]MBW9146139.1 nitroreductase family protein [Clostridium sp. CM027]MBW9148204.1 nitroreductase family protein [Clostridium sp. CM028]UVE41685.1 nitroreductase family protein [Clostridium sp. CM027]WAG70686.1 nitroreductase family protein [Clostridium sp. CF011]